MLVDSASIPDLEVVQMDQHDAPIPLNQPNPAQEDRDLAIAEFLRQHPASSGDSGLYSPFSENQN